MSSQTRTMALLGATAVLLGAVVADRTGVLDRVINAGGGGAVEAAYAAKARQFAEQESLTAWRDDWERAALEADAAMDAIEGRVIREASVARAQDELLRLARFEFESAGMPVLGYDPGDAGGVISATSGGLQRVGLVFTTSTDDPARVTRLIDGLENMDGAIATIERIELRGPGPMQHTGTLDATIVLTAPAIIDGGTA